MNKLKLVDGMERLDAEREAELCGGFDDQNRNLFFQIGEAIGYLVKGLIVFSTEGGRNAGLTVK